MMELLALLVVMTVLIMMGVGGCVLTALVLVGGVLALLIGSLGLLFKLAPWIALICLLLWWLSRRDRPSRPY